MFALRAQIEKCSQVFSELYLSRQPFGPKRNKRVSRIVVDILPHGSGAFWFDSGQWQPSSSDQLRLVMDRQGALENDLMQERQARAEAERRLSVALGEVGGRADVAVVERLLPGKREFQLWMGCIDTRLLGKPDKFDGQDSCWRDWKFITKAYIQAALPEIRALLVRAEETSDDVRNVVLNAPEQALSVQLYYMLALLTKNRALDKVQAAGEGEGNGSRSPGVASPVCCWAS